MRRIGWLFCLSAVGVLGAADRASASPLRLEISGDADALSIHDPVKLDVSDGFSKYTIGGGGHALNHRWETEDWSKPITSGMRVYASLFAGDQYLGNMTFSVPVTGELRYWGATARFGADARGVAQGSLSISPFADPSLIPSWFTGLTATVDSSVGGGRQNWYSSTLTIAVAPVPEPSSALVFLVAAGFIGYRRHRRG